MIPQSSKFPLRTEFLRFRTRAERQTTTHTNIYHLTSKFSASRLAVVVPKKLSKRATTRNWLKRLTYDAVWPLIQAKKLDCVVIYKPLPLKKSLQIKKELINELAQATGNL